MKIILPIKDNSARFPGKNFESFYEGEPMPVIKIRQLLRHFRQSDITIIGDGPGGRRFADRFGLNWLSDGHINKEGFEFAVRFWFTEVTDDDCVMLTYSTCPLFDYYGQMMGAWDREKHDSIFSGSPLRHFVTDEKGVPLNFQYGYHHRTSEYLPKWVQMDWSTFIIDGKVAREALYPVGRTPQVFVQPEPSVDVDNKQDFELAQWYYNRMKTS